MKNELDLKIIKLISKGMLIKDVSNLLKSKNTKGCSVSSIEKRLNSIRKIYKAKTSVHLFVILSKKGII